MIVLLSVGVIVALAGCVDSDSELVDFENEHVSLSLPGSFVGGDPADPVVMESLEEYAAANPNPLMRGELAQYLQQLESSLGGIDQEPPGRSETAGLMLLVWGPPVEDGSIPGVYVGRTLLDDLSGDGDGVGDGDGSLEALVGELMSSWPDSAWQIESLTEDTALVVLSQMVEGTDEVVVRERHVFKSVDDYLYEFCYIYPSEASADLDAAFIASGQTAIVK